MKYLIKIATSNNEPCYVADWIGDPGRTILKINAKLFKTRADAEKEIKKIQKEYPLRPRKYSIKPISDLSNMI